MFCRTTTSRGSRRQAKDKSLRRRRNVDCRQLLQPDDEVAVLRAHITSRLRIKVSISTVAKFEKLSLIA